MSDPVPPKPISLTTQSLQETSVITKEKPKRSFKIFQTLFILLIVAIVLGIGYLYKDSVLDLFASKEGKSTVVPSGSPSAKPKTSTDTRAIIFIKQDGTQDNSSRRLGSIVIYKLGEKREETLLPKGKVKQIALSKDQQLLAYLKDDGEQQGLWYYDFQSDKEKQVDQFDELNGENLDLIDDVIWRGDAKKLAYIVNTRKRGADVRQIIKNQVRVYDIVSKKTALYRLPNEFTSDLVGWVGDKLFYVQTTDDYGIKNFGHLDLNSKKIKKDTEILADIAVPYPDECTDPSRLVLIGSRNVGNQLVEVRKLINLADIKLITELVDTQSTEHLVSNNCEEFFYTDPRLGALKFTKIATKDTKLITAPVDFPKDLKQIKFFGKTRSLVTGNYSVQADEYNYAFFDLDKEESFDLPNLKSKKFPTNFELLEKFSGK